MSTIHKMIKANKTPLLLIALALWQVNNLPPSIAAKKQANSERSHHKKTLSDWNFLTKYGGRSTNELIRDKSFVSLLEAIAPEHNNLVESGSSLVDSAFDRMGGPPDSIKIIENRYVIVSASMNNFAPAKCLLLCDIAGKKGLIALTDGEEWPSLYLISKQYDAIADCPQLFQAELNDWLNRERVPLLSRVYVSKKGVGKREEFDKLNSLSKLIERQPDYKLYERRADLLAESGKLRESIKDYDKVIELCPAENKLTLSRAYAARATALKSDNKLQEALSDLDQAIKLNPCTYEAASYFARRGMIYELLNDNERALSDFDAAIKANKGYPGYLQRALFFHRLNQNDKAMADLNEELKKCGSYLKPKILRTKAEILVCQDKLNEGLQAIDQAIKLEPSSKDALLLEKQIKKRLNSK